MKFRGPKPGDIFKRYGAFVGNYCQEAAALMGYEVVEDEPTFAERLEASVKHEEETNMDKPRICEVLGVEVGEQFQVNNFSSADFHFDRNGELYVEGTNDPEYCSAIIQAINHPDRIIRKPRFTQQEVEDAKTIKRMFGADNFTHIHKDEDGWTEMMDGPGEDGTIGWCSIGMEEGMFPSIPPGETVTLDEIIGGAK